MNKPLISIIVPVYNAERYIYQCLDSILKQTYTNFEVILVDDGSTDKSGVICDEYAKKDTRFKVIHQENGGVSVARQTGTDAATGEYTIHIDPDDWVDETMLEELFTKAKETNADMVICDFVIEDNIGTHYCSQNPGKDISAENVLKKILFQQMHGSCWNKLVKRACYNGISFSPTHICILEDELFNIRVLTRDIKVTYLAKAFYHYRLNNNNSLCHSLSNKSLNSEIDVVTEIETLLLNECSFINPEDFYVKKKNVLFDAMRTKHFNHLKDLYPEIQARVINEGRKYRWYMPRTCCLSIALRGNITLANYIYDINIWLINQMKIIKKKWNK